MEEFIELLKYKIKCSNLTFDCEIDIFYKLKNIKRKLIVPFNNQKLYKNQKIYEFIKENINEPIIFALAHKNKSYLHLLELPEVYADANKFKCNVSFDNNMIYFEKLIDQDKFIGNKILYYGYLPIIRKLILKGYFAISKSCSILDMYLNFEIEDKNVIQAITNYLLIEYPDYTFTLNPVGKYMYFEQYDGPIFVMYLENPILNTYEKEQQYIENVKNNILQSPDIYKFYELVIQNKIIITSPNLIFNEPEYIRALISCPETFLRYQNTIRKLSNYEKVTNINIKSAK